MSTQAHKYAYEVQPGSAPEKVIRMVGMGKRVLELGPGPGSITRHLKKNGCRITALEADREAIGFVAEFCEQVHACDMNDAQWPGLLAGADRFPVIVAADVLEHLYDPWTTLEKLRPLLSEDGCVVISLPHAGHNAIVACLLDGDFEYRPWGLLDKTHIRFWGLKNIQALFEGAGLKIVEAEFVVKTPEQTELAGHWQRLPAELRQALAWNRAGNIYQVVLRAVPRIAPGSGLQLESLAVPAPASGAGIRTRISGILRRLGIGL